MNDNYSFLFALIFLASGVWLYLDVAMHLWKNSDRRYKTVSSEEFKKFKENMRRLETEHLEKELLGKMNSLEELKKTNRTLERCARKYNSY